MNLEKLIELAKNYPDMKIILSTDNKVWVEFCKTKDSKDSLENLGYSFEVGM